MSIRAFAALAAALLAAASLDAAPGAAPAFLPGARVVLDAHNAYPYEGRHADRVERALAAGLPVAIEQDVAWCRTASGRFDAVVAHSTDCRGDEPTLASYFFDRLAPVMTRALAEGPSRRWPLVTLNLDFKMDPPDLHAAVWDLLGRHAAWLTTAPRTSTPGTPAPLHVGPLLVLTGEADGQQTSFHDDVPVGGTLRLFGAVHSAAAAAPGAPPRPGPATNYRRWWNHSWKDVEPEGQPQAGPWTPADRARLDELVASAHRAGLWIRFYTLDGFDAAEGERQGWFATYNFGSRAAAERRWRAAIAAGVDFVATDQYEAFAAVKARESVQAVSR